MVQQISTSHSPPSVLEDGGFFKAILTRRFPPVLSGTWYSELRPNSDKTPSSRSFMRYDISGMLKSPRNGSEDEGESEGIDGEPCEENDDRKVDSESVDHISIGEEAAVSDFDEREDAPGDPARDDAEEDG